MSVAVWLTALLATAAPTLEMALTFDDLPGEPAHLAAIDAALQRHGVRGVYGFVNGAQLEGCPERAAALRAWVRAGQAVGNHTFSHADLSKLSLAAYEADVQRDEAVLTALAPPQPWRVFRFPYLREGFNLPDRAALRAYLRERRYRVAQVSADAFDWSFDEAYARCTQQGDAAGARAVRKRFLDEALAQLRWSDATGRTLTGRPIRHILLAHSRGLTADAADALLDGYAAAGVRFISLARAMQDPIYGQDPALVVDGDNFLQQLVRARHMTDGAPYPEHPRAWILAMCRGSAAAPQ